MMLILMDKGDGKMEEKNTEMDEIVAEMVKRMLPTYEKVAAERKATESDPKCIERQRRRDNAMFQQGVKGLLEKKLIYCPHCGESKLVWACCKADFVETADVLRSKLQDCSLFRDLKGEGNGKR